MFINNLDPTLLSFGPFEIRYYGLVYVIGFLVTLWYLLYLQKKDILKLSKDKIYDLILYIMVGTILGARIFEVVFYNPLYYIGNPLKILAIWQGGLSVHGGIVGVIIVALIFSKKNKIKFLKLADIVVVPAIAFLALGRIANFINGELVGTITNVEWCVVFKNYDGCRHPYQIYNFFARSGLFLYLLYLSQKDRFKDGYIFFNFVLFMGIIRFALDFWRFETTYIGLTMGQYLSIPLILIGGYYVYKYRK